MSHDQISTLLQRFAIDPWSSGDLSGLDETTTEDYVLVGEAGHPDEGLDALKDTIRTFRAAFPDLSITIEETIAQDDRLAYRWTMRGTHQAEFDGIAPTGKELTASGITIVHLRDGKVALDRFESSSPSAQEQLAAT